MSSAILETRRISMAYSRRLVLRDVNITLEAGKIYGLIGQNGAGKTTLMRILAGLSFPTEGEVCLFGKTSRRQLQEERKRLGCMIEYPSILASLSAKDNMRYHRLIRGMPGTGREAELLDLVGLGGAGNKKAGHFSLGMKQRLGIAEALLSGPEFLILDEPANGLDPVGVVEIRTLLKRLCEEKGMTILVSSHNLPELYQTATNYMIIHQGSIKKCLTHAELDERCASYVKISCTQPNSLATLLESRLGTTSFKVMPDRSFRLYGHVAQTEMLAKLFMDSGLVITHFSVEGDTLEDYFLSVIGGNENG